MFDCLSEWVSNYADPGFIKLGLHNIFWHNFSIYLSNFFNLSSEKEYPYLPLPFYYTSAPPEGGILFYLGPSFCPSVCPRYFFQQLLMAEIWYLVTSFIWVPHIVGSVFGPIRFLLPVCWLCWFLYTLNIHFVYGWF